MKYLRRHGVDLTAPDLFIPNPHSLRDFFRQPVGDVTLTDARPSLLSELTRIAMPLVVAAGLCVILAHVKPPEVQTPPPQVSIQKLAQK